MLSNAYFLAKFRFDTAENEPAKNLQNFAKFANFADPNPLIQWLPSVRSRRRSFRANYDAINYMMRDQNLPLGLQLRVRKLAGERAACVIDEV